MPAAQLISSRRTYMWMGMRARLPEYFGIMPKAPLLS
jgi:hypothetical protein